MDFRDSLQFLPAFLEQLLASLAKVGRGYFQNLHDVVTDVFPEADVECSSGKESFATITSTLSRGSMITHYHHERPSSTSGGVEC